MTTMAAVRRRERLEYIADMLHQLARMAEVEKDYFLGYLIEMAVLEAKYEVGAGVPAGILPPRSRFFVQT